jgi:osmotically-inducible protein OsmY
MHPSYRSSLAGTTTAQNNRALEDQTDPDDNQNGPRAKIMKYVLTFIIGFLMGIGTHWYLTQPKGQATAANAGESMRETVTNVGHTLKDSFDSEKIKDELSRTGKVIREKAGQAGDAIADATANARTTAAIKAKLIKESSLSAFKIDVDTTDGVVTLSGTVSSYDEIAKAMSIAWETEGVHKVVSTLQVKPN